MPHTGTLSWEAASAAGEKLEQAFPVVCVQLVLHLTAVIIKCSQSGFWGTRCCQDPPRVLSDPLATRTGQGGKGLHSPGSRAGNAQRLL